MKRVLIAIAACVAVLGLTLVVSWPQRPASDTGLEEIAPGDAQFWLMQSGRSDRLIPCSARYRFDSPVDEALLRERLQALTAPYRMFRRNVVEVNGLPYWQSVNIDWNVNFRVLEPEEDADAVRDAAEVAVSQASAPGDGVPLFRAILSADGRELTFVWHHVISDLEGMFNAHARHLFAREDERTRFGYQITEASAPEGASPSSSLASAFAERPLGFTGYGFDIGRHVLPVTDVALHALGAEAGLPMSDVFSLIALRTVTRYHADDAPEQVLAIRPMVTPLSLRKDSRTVDEGNRRAVKQFPIVFPLQPLDATVNGCAFWRRRRPPTRWSGGRSDSAARCRCSRSRSGGQACPTTSRTTSRLRTHRSCSARHASCATTCAYRWCPSSAPSSPGRTTTARCSSSCTRIRS